MLKNHMSHASASAKNEIKAIKFATMHATGYSILVAPIDMASKKLLASLE